MADDITIEQIATEAYNNVVKKKNDNKLADTYLSAEVQRKQRLVDELKAEIEFLQHKRNTLAETLKTEKKELLDSIEARRSDAEKKFTDARTELENVLRDRNFLDQEKSNVNGLRQQLANSKNEADDLIKRIKDFANSIR